MQCPKCFVEYEGQPGDPCPRCGYSDVSQAPTIAAGLPWDERHQIGFVSALWETAKLVLLNPSYAFSRMRTQGGIGSPLLYYFILGMIGHMAGTTFTLFSQSVLMQAIGQQQPAVGPVSAAAFSLIMLILGPILIVIGAFLVSGIVHLSAIVCGVASKDYEATFRMICFTIGSTMPLQFIPILLGMMGLLAGLVAKTILLYSAGQMIGALFVTVWTVILYVIGIRTVHGTTTWRAVLTLFLPFIVFACCCGGTAALIPALAGMKGM